MIEGLASWFSGAKLWLVGAVLSVAFLALVMWRAYSAGSKAAAADAAIKGIERALKANAAKQDVLRRSQATKEKERDNDPNNRDNWR